MTDAPRIPADESATYAAIVENSNDAIVGHTLDGTIVTWNRAAERIFGYSPQEVIGRPISVIMLEGQDEEIGRIRQSLRRGQGVQHFETQRRRKDGRIIHVSITVSPIRDGSGRVVGASRITRDITQRKEMEAALRQSEERFSKAFGVSPDGLVLSAPADGTIHEVNESFLTIFGLAREEVIGRRSVDLGLFSDPADRERAMTIIRRDGRLRDYELTVRRRTGERRIALLCVEMLDSGGEALMLTSIRDITDQRRAEQALRESETRAHAILDTAVESIITIDERGIVESMNPAAERLFGYPAAEVIGRNVSMLMPQPYQREHDQYIRNYLETGNARIIGIGREVAGRRKDGSVFPIDLAVSEVRLGARRLFTGIIHDLSARKKLEQAIVEAGDREKRSIGQDLHDGLGQLLTGIGFLSKALEQRLGSRSIPEAADAKEIADLMTQAIAQARGLARGLQPVRDEPTGLMAAVEELCSTIESMFRVACTFDCPEPVLIEEQSMANQLYRIAQEAVNNAIRHGKARRIVIRLSSDDEQIALVVEDDGAGLPATLPAKRGMGLQIMNYRAALIGGHLAVRRRSTAGGTVVSCAVRHVPFAERSDDAERKVTAGQSQGSARR